MKLTGIAKERFLDYYWKNYIGKTRFLNQKSETEDFFDSLYPVFKTALIIDWFREFVGYEIKATSWKNVNEIVYYFSCEKVGEPSKYNSNECTAKSHKEAIESAIIKANEIFNELNK